jgi:hypothetical protein
VSIDRRLRSGFERSAPAIESNDHEALERVRVRARRAAVTRRVTTIMTVSLAAVVAVVGGRALLDGLREPVREPVSQPTPAVPTGGGSSIIGTFTTTLKVGDPAVDANLMTGEWIVTFRSTGILEIAPPPSFDESHSGYSFEVSGDVFRTDLFRTGICNDDLPGRYRWQRSGQRVTFEAVDETCPAREALFTVAPWELMSSPT